MSNTVISEVKYVQKDIFDEKLINIQDKLNSDRKLTDEKFDKMQILMEKNFAELNAKINKVEDTLSLAIMGLADRFEDMKDYQNKWFTVFGVLLGVLTIAFSVLAFFK